MFHRLRDRVCVFVVAILCGAAALEAWQTALASGSRGARAVGIAAAAGGVWLGLAALFPVLISGPLQKIRPLARTWTRLEELDARERAGVDLRPRFSVLAAVMVVWGAACLAANIFGNSLDPPPVWLDDQGAYLERAEEMRNPAGSMLTLPQLYADLRTGRFREDNRHPLFLGLLALAPGEEFGRQLAGGFGLAAFLSGVVLVWHRFCPLAAGLFAILLGMNHNLGQFSVMVVCETLLIWWISLAYFVLLPPAAAGRSLARRRGRILLASVFLGLAYLTKATGLLFFGVFMVWLAWQSRPRGDEEIPSETDRLSVISWTEPYPLRQWVIALLCGGIGFLAVSFPLLERNVRAFGNPFHNVNSLLLFTDDYSHFDNLIRGGVTTKEAADDYFRTHTIGQMVDRELRGLVWEAFIMLRSLGPKGLDDGRVLFGLPIAVFCGVGLWFERRPAKWLLLGWIGACWVVFAWYVPIAAGDRFPIPLLLPALAHASDGMARTLRALR